MGLMADLACSACGLTAKGVHDGQGERSRLAVYYCRQCDRLHTHAVRTSRRDATKVWLDDYPRGCSDAHDLTGPLAIEWPDPIECPRCRQRTLIAEPAGIWD